MHGIEGLINTLKAGLVQVCFYVSYDCYKYKNKLASQSLKRSWIPIDNGDQGWQESSLFICLVPLTNIYLEATICKYCIYLYVLSLLKTVIFQIFFFTLPARSHSY